MSTEEQQFMNMLTSKGSYKFKEIQIIRRNKKKYFLYIPFSFLVKDLNCTIPLSQRSRVKERLDYFEEFIEEEYKKNKEIPDLNILSIGFYESKFYLMDGQHRFTALKAYYEKNKKPMKDYYIMTTCYIISNKTEFKGILSQINNNFVSEAYLFQINEEDVDDESIDVKKKNIMDYMEKNFHIYLSDKLDCKSPYINKIVFLEYIFDIYPNSSTYKMITGIDKANKELEEEYKNNDPEFYNHISEFVEERKDIKPLFFGKILEKENKIKIESLKPGRRKFSDALKRKLWFKYYKNDLVFGECMHCGYNKLTFNSFDISHIQSIKNKGSNELSNLTILCDKCNKSFGGTNLYEHPDFSIKDMEERKERLLKKKNEEEETKSKDDTGTKFKKKALTKNEAEETKSKEEEVSSPKKKTPIKKEGGSVLVL